VTVFPATRSVCVVKEIVRGLFETAGTRSVSRTLTLTPCTWPLGRIDGKLERLASSDVVLTRMQVAAFVASDVKVHPILDTVAGPMVTPVSVIV
jgi:hypothetical protein